ncbi:hypothetical protein FDE29_24095 [Vibrio parahaemolyticus]|uniref:hypothetical protein n=1 Tax=Vibrio parahaemolyticus TaxID=670 RepID=UPI0004A37301|nr:hypothetical protein [Vibrio parahaemolyticus]EGR0439598.1 hypothetical protein [Vibrio parahaemolyticus]EGR0766572.1 hypothetical protein [Vibrio parahaemolyticus]EGR2568487.1 hypothetical protein [Vibrio parahaemolyticus]EGR3330530.1 hypothetical protein [Vibrio parahaemolyticus]EHK9610710.1 hypothetical protein [Vibrio parahaemolyticus]
MSNGIECESTLLTAIENLDALVSSYLGTLQFSSSVSIDKMINDVDSKTNKFVYDISGIYFIEVKTSAFCRGKKDWKEEFIKFWDEDKFHGCFTPKSKKKRLDAHNERQLWTPLYIGKCQNIRKRLINHRDLRLDQRTRGLKLNARGIYKNSSNFRVSYIPVSKDLYSSISSKVETHFREEINPIVGI